MIIESSTKIDVRHDTTVKKLKEVLEVIPDGAQISVDKYPGNQGDPGYSHLIFRWKVIT